MKKLITLALLLFCLKSFSQNSFIGDNRFRNITATDTLRCQFLVITGTTPGVGKVWTSDADGVGSWQVATTYGDVYKVGTPTANQLAFWTGDGTIKGVDTAGLFGAGGGGGGTPAGNYGNVQLNRNGAFATPASDSLNFAAGLAIKGTLTTTGAITNNGNYYYGSNANGYFRSDGSVGSGLFWTGTNKYTVDGTGLHMFGNSGSYLEQLTVSGSNGEVVVNDASANNILLRVEGDNDANLIYTDPVNDRLGIGTATPLSKLDVSGSTGRAITTTTANLTLDATHSTVIVTGGTPTITLPTASGVTRRVYRVVNQTGSAVTVSSYLDFAGASATTILANSAIEFQSNGTNWYRIL